MIQALNNHHFLFRWIYRFYTTIGRMSNSAQWAIILGLFIGMRILRSFADANPEWQPYVFPISVLYLSFCLLSWIATPLFNTFLRFHPFGKYLLSDKEKMASNLIAVLGVIGILGATLQSARGDYGGAMLMFVVPVFVSMPIATAFQVDRGWPLYVCIAFTIVIGLAALMTIAMIPFDGPWGLPILVYGLGLLVFSFLGNYLSQVTVRN